VPEKRAFAGPFETDGFENNVIATGLSFAYFLKKDGTAEGTAVEAEGNSMNLPTGSCGVAGGAGVADTTELG